MSSGENPAATQSGDQAVFVEERDVGEKERRYVLSRIDTYTGQMKRKTARNQGIERLADFVHTCAVCREEFGVAKGMETFTTLMLYPGFPLDFLKTVLKTEINSITSFDLSFDQKYARQIDKMLPLVADKKRSKEQVYADFLQNFQDIADGCLRQYNGENFKISDKIGNHGKSLLITPQYDGDAISLLSQDKIRTVFAKYDQYESAETYVSQFYGTDGKYAGHYNKFLSSADRYKL